MAESVRIGPRFAVRAVAVAALTMLTVVAPVLAFGGPVLPAGADGGGGYFTCTGISGITHEPIGYTVTMAAGSSGSAYLGGTYISNCELTGTVPSGWGVGQDTSVTLDDGSENDGTWVINTDDQTVTGAGTFTNTGTLTDDSDGFSQTFDVPDFVNTGTVVSVEGSGNTECPGFIISGTGTVFENQGLVTSETGGCISFENGTFELETGGTVSASPGLVALAQNSTLDVEGGSVTSGAITTTTFLGHTASEVEFGSSVPAGSSGTVNITNSITLSGTVASGWTVEITGGSTTVTPGSGNDGAIEWVNPGNSTFSDSGTFTNAGTFTAESNSQVQDIAVADFVNTGTLESNSTGLELSDGSSSDLFDNQGSVTVGAGDTATVSTGTFELDNGGTIAAAGGAFALAQHCTFEVAGGSVTSGVVSTVVTLGVGPSNLTFAPSVPSGSAGTVDLTSAITLNGTIASGWTVEAASGTLTAGAGSGNDGTLIFEGAGNFNGSGSFTNNATLTAQSGVTVNIAAFTNGPTGTVTAAAGGPLTFASGAPPTNLSGGVLTGGSWSAGARLNFNAPFTTDDATMALTSSSGIFATGTYLSFVFDALNTLTTIDSGASLALTGGATDTVDGSLVNDGTLTLGSNDSLTVDNSLTESSTATLATTLAGTTTGSYGHVTVTLGATLGGTLQLATGGGYTPSPGDIEAVVTGSPVTGTFAAITGQTTWPEGVSTVDYSASAADVVLVSISLNKVSLTDGYGRAGDTIDYSYGLTNDTQSTLTGLAVTDSLIAGDAISCPSTTLAAGASETCTASYSVSQGDVDAGSVTNTAQVTGTYPPSVTLSSPTSTVTVPASGATSSLSLVKSTTTGGYGAAGDSIDYSYAVTNTGTETLSNVAVDDNVVPGSDISCPDATLATGAAETCTASYAVSQADVDTGSVTNTAYAAATNPHATVVDSGTSSVTVEANEATATLSLSESSPAANFTATGQPVEFDYTVTNTGTTTLHDVQINDTLSVASDPSCQWDSLAPGTSQSCSGSYTTTAADMTARSITDSAQASATTLHGPASVDSSTTTVTVMEQAITTVTFLKGPSAPEVVVTGINLGTRPQAVGACSAGNTDWANGALAFSDLTTFTGSGAPGDCVGLAIVSYSPSQVVFTFGTQYKNYPPLAGGDAYSVEVGNATFSGTVAYDFPTVFSVIPHAGPGAGGTKVTITGAGMVSPSAVHFGSVRATSVVASALGTSVTAVAPAEAAGTVDVTVTTSGGTSTTSSADQFTYLAPTVTSVSPHSGAAAGGNKVTINGRALNKASSVLFGSMSAISFTVNPLGTSITAVAPGQGAGPVDVTVTTAGGTSATSPADTYTYLAPTVTTLKPSSGPGAGGNTVTIDGIALNGATAVMFGSTPAGHYSVNSYGTAITATAPAETAGSVYVTVTTPGGTSATTAGSKYTFLGPSITKVSPTTGPAAGGTTVTITGKNLNGATVKFGTATVSGVVVSPSGTSLTAVSPPESEVGPVLILVGPPAGAGITITVTTPGGTAQKPFVYV